MLKFLRFINLLYCFILSNLVKSDLIYYSIGAITDSTLTIKAKTKSEKITFILGTITIPEASPDSDGYCTINAQGLSADTNYEISYKLNTGNIVNTKQSVKTLRFQPGPTILNFIATSNAKSGSSALLYKRMADLKPNFLLFLGNFNKDETCSDSWKDYEKSYLKSKLAI